MAVEGVVGIGQGECEGKPCIKVFVLKKNDQTVKLIPAKLDGFTVSIEETGEFKVL